MRDNNYVIAGKWVEWFAWRPVKDKNGRLLWGKRIRCRPLMLKWWLVGTGIPVTAWEYASAIRNEGEQG